MKTLLLAIISAIGIGTGIAVLIIYGNISPALAPSPNWNFDTTKNNENNLDFSASTTENPLGIKARIVMEVDRSISCIRPCTIPPSLHLVLTSEKGAQFSGYQVCDGISCKKDNLENSLYVHLDQIPQNYSGATGLEASHINLGDLPWNLGDIVHILVKAFPVTLQPNDVVIRESGKVMTVDLGTSKLGGCDDPEQTELKHDVESFTKRISVENMVLADPILYKLIDNSNCEFMGLSTLYTENGSYQILNINLNNTKLLTAQVSLQNSSVTAYNLGNLSRSDTSK
ncbi:MAG: hypothetical protein ACREBJ_07010 [Nitrosotalea sp.]